MLGNGIAPLIGPKILPDSLWPRWERLWPMVPALTKLILSHWHAVNRLAETERGTQKNWAWIIHYKTWSWTGVQCISAIAWHRKGNGAGRKVMCSSFDGFCFRSWCNAPGTMAHVQLQPCAACTCHAELFGLETVIHRAKSVFAPSACETSCSSVGCGVILLHSQVRNHWLLFVRSSQVARQWFGSIPSPYIGCA